MTSDPRPADLVTSIIGSWRFLVAQSGFLTFWITLNVIGWMRYWEPYPFILLNLMLLFLAASTAPTLLMSANRQAALDRARAYDDHLVNQRAEAEVEELVDLMRAQIARCRGILDRLGTPTPAVDRCRHLSPISSGRTAAHRDREGR